LGYIADGTQRLFAGNYGGQVFTFDEDTLNDGVRVGTTHTTTFTPGGVSISTISGTGFDTTGAGLAQRYAVILDSNRVPFAKVLIASNTSTVLTLATTLAGLTAGTTYTAYVGSPDLRLYTKWMDMDQTFIRKRFDRAYIQVDALGGPSDLLLSTRVDFIQETLPSLSVINLTGSMFDSAIFDTSTFAGVGQIKKRISILRTGQGLQISLYHFVPNQDMIVRGIAVLARAMSDRVYE